MQAQFLQRLLEEYQRDSKVETGFGMVLQPGMNNKYTEPHAANRFRIFIMAVIATTKRRSSKSPLDYWKTLPSALRFAHRRG